MVKIAHTRALFDNVTNNLAARHNRGVDLLLMRVIGTNSSDKKPGVNLSFSNEWFMGSRAGYADVAAANTAR
jgi:hypothetical protein